MDKSLNLHAARMMMNHDDDLRAWVEQWLKGRLRATIPEVSDEEFKLHWKYVRPETMHEGALEVVTAYQERSIQH